MLADTTFKRLNAISDISKQGKRVNGLFRLLENPEIWKLAYSNIYGNKGAITKGVDNNTLDGFSYKRVENLINSIKNGSYMNKPVRRVQIPKKNGKTRPLGIPNGDDKLVQEVVRIILSEIYEPIFSTKSHGFRTGYSCHTALSQVKRGWTGTKWIIEMDIKGFFDNLSHEKLLFFLEKKIDDKRFVSLIANMLTAGYMENWQYNKTYSGTPQGGIVSPILANIYLHELDNFVEEMISRFNIGKERHESAESRKLRSKMEVLRRRYNRIKHSATETELQQIQDELEQIYKKRMEIPWGDAFDSSYKRMFYCRYADDFIVGVIGSKAEAKQIAGEIRNFIETQLDLEIAEDKFHIKHATEGVRFLGYDVQNYSANKVIRKKLGDCNVPQRVGRERIQLILPKEKLQAFAKEHGYGDYYSHSPECRQSIVCGSDAEIISTYNDELRGFCNYYALANSANKRLGDFVSLARTSCAMTIAKKHKTSTNKIIKSMKQSNGEWIRSFKDDKGKEYHHRIYRIKTDFKAKQINYDSVDILPNTKKYCYSRTELISKLNANVCEWCGSTVDVEVHHVKALKDVEKAKDNWAVFMAARKRKTMCLCKKCHTKLHHGTLGPKTT